MSARPQSAPAASCREPTGRPRPLKYAACGALAASAREGREWVPGRSGHKVKQYRRLSRDQNRGTSPKISRAIATACFNASGSRFYARVRWPAGTRFRVMPEWRLVMPGVETRYARAETCYARMAACRFPANGERGLSEAWAMPVRQARSICRSTRLAVPSLLSSAHTRDRATVLLGCKLQLSRNVLAKRPRLLAAGVYPGRMPGAGHNPADHMVCPS